MSGNASAMLGRVQLTNGGGGDIAAWLMGAGTASSPSTTARAGLNAIGFWVKATASTGTSRGMYLRQYLSGGAGGEALRAYNTCSSNTPADTVNGAHISQNFGSSAGNVTGLGTAVRATFHVPNRSLGGTTAAVMAELYHDGASSVLGGKTACVRLCNDGNATAVAAADLTAYAFSFSGFTAGSGKVISATGNEPTWTSNAIKIKCWDETAGRVFYLLGLLA